jgi:hypothetical protein
VKRAVIAAALAAAALVTAVPAQADQDTDFSNELQVYGIYGQKDYYAWIGKITCKRQVNGLDTDAAKSARFISMQLPRGQNSTEQSYQFLAAALRTYCPERLSMLLPAEQQPPAPPPAGAPAPLPAER